MAHTSARTDLDRDGWQRLGATLGGPIEEIRPGNVIRFPPGEKHWHGATPSPATTHLSVLPKFDGKAVEWMEKVREEQ